MTENESWMGVHNIAENNIGCIYVYNFIVEPTIRDSFNRAQQKSANTLLESYWAFYHISLSLSLPQLAHIQKRKCTSSRAHFEHNAHVHEFEW